MHISKKRVFRPINARYSTLRGDNFLKKFMGINHLMAVLTPQSRSRSVTFRLRYSRSNFHPKNVIFLMFARLTLNPTAGGKMVGTIWKIKFLGFEWCQACFASLPGEKVIPDWITAGRCGNIVFWLKAGVTPPPWSKTYYLCVYIKFCTCIKN